MANNERTVTDAVVDKIDNGIIVVDRNERVVRWNEWMVSASGYSAESVHHKSLSEIFSGRQINRINLATRSAIESNASTTISHALNPNLLPLRTRSGRIMLHDVTVSPLAGGANTSCLIVVTDVTLVMRRERHLREQQNARYYALLTSAPDVIITIDSTGLIQNANPAAVSHLGYKVEELIGTQAATLFAPICDWPSAWRNAFDQAHQFQSKELVLIRKDGSLSYVEASAAKWNIASTEFLTVILRDINERRAADAALRASELAARTAAEALLDLNQTLEQRVKERTDKLMKAEEALRQSQKMEAIGQLTGGIAHDFNNLLQGITGALNLIQKRIATGCIGDIERLSVAALDAAHRAAALTHRLLAFARQQPIDPRPVDENRLIASTEELLRRTIGENLQLKFKLSDDLWLVRCDANQLENVILNLAINARDAMPIGGTLTFETANKLLKGADEARAKDLDPGEYVCLTVTDTGAGMSLETQTRIFDPFFTTKSIGKGTGLGLSMVYGFVKQSSGSILVHSEVGKGTEFEIWLPRFKGEPDGLLAAKEIEEGSVGGGEVVLVVEDEGIVRILVVEVLKELGYHVLEAETGAAALRILQSPQRIDLLVTDIGMPDITGRQVADAARTLRQELRVLFMTGYAEKAANSNFLRQGMKIISKPFTMDAFAILVRQIIEGE